MTLTDELESVIRRAQKLEPEAFDWLVDAYSARLFGFLYRLTGRRDDADELVQEVFVRVVSHIARYQHDGRFEAWLFRIATNLARDRVRRIARSPEIGSLDGGPSDAEPSMADRLPDEAGDAPERRMEHEEDVDRLQEALGKLPDAEREVVMLRHYGNLSFNEIATLMATPLGTALARAHRGLAKLREMMEAA